MITLVSPSLNIGYRSDLVSRRLTACTRRTLGRNIASTETRTVYIGFERRNKRKTMAEVLTGARGPCALSGLCTTYRASAKGRIKACGSERRFICGTLGAFFPRDRRASVGTVSGLVRVTGGRIKCLRGTDGDRLSGGATGTKRGGCAGC